MSIRSIYLAAPLLAALAFAPMTASAGGSPAVTTSAVHDFPDGPTKAGASSTLVRNDAGVTGTFLAPNLNPGDTYTFWWVIFNHPENCSDGVCGLDDAAPFPGNPAVGVSLVIGGGQVIGNSGDGYFGSHLAPGDVSGALFGPGLLDPIAAEIHIVLRNHGQVIPELLDDQLGSFGGGCEVNSCSNEISATHLPLADQTSAEVSAIKALLERVAIRQGIRP